MRIVQINATCEKGSTGKICLTVSRLLTARGHENHIRYSSGKSEYTLGIPYTNRGEVLCNALRSRLSGNYGFTAKAATRRLIARLEYFQPDIVHLHNVHSHDVDLELLIAYLKEQHIKAVWTFHDCWAFTGYCPHFDAVGCEKWKTACGDCPLKRRYSWLFDNSRRLFEKKKALLADLDLTIVTPSQWMADLVGRSFLGGKPVKTIRNGIDLSAFSPTESDFRRRYGSEDKKVVLGVAYDWDERKGLDVFCSLSEQLPEEYRIVLVGVSEKVQRRLPDNIVSVRRVSDRRELASIYTAADVFVNPTREEALGLVNLEALACGTPGVTFRTGGSPECYDETCGAVVEKNDVDAMAKEIVRICQTDPYPKEACVRRARCFDENDCFRQYVELYETLLDTEKM